MLDEIKNDIEKEFSEICDYSNDCKNKQKVLDANTNDSKFTKIGTIGIFSFLPFLIIVYPETAGLSLRHLTTWGVAYASSLAIGCVGQFIITSISKRKMKKFTSAKKNSDIVEEMMYYEMEMYKSKHRIEALREMYKSIESTQLILGDDSIEFYQNKYENLTPEDLKRRKEMLSKAYEERMKQLDVLTLQAYLKKRNLGSKRERVGNIIIYALMISLFISFMISIPSLEESLIAGIEDMGRLFAICFSPALVVTPLSLLYFIKRDKDFMKGFHNLNQSLGEKALSEELNIENEKELENMISLKLSEIVKLGVELKEIGYAIEKTNIETSTDIKSKEDMSFQDHPENYMSCDDNEEEYEEVLNRTFLDGEEKGPKLVHKRKPIKK